jgi:hypothetical protein
VSLGLQCDDPETVAAGTEKFGGAFQHSLKTGDPNVLAAVANGRLYLYGAEDGVASKSVSLCQLGVGKWLDGEELKKAEQKKVTNKCLLIAFRVESEDDQFTFTCKPDFQTKFPASPQPMKAFLKHLEANAVTTASIVNHKPIDRKVEGGKTKYSFELGSATKFSPTPPKDTSVAAYWALQLKQEDFETSGNVCVIVSTEYHQTQTMLVPEYCHLYLKKDIRVFKNKLTRVL